MLRQASPDECFDPNAFGMATLLGGKVVPPVAREYGRVELKTTGGLMGSWAVFANRAHPMPAPLLAGLIQGTLSALITLLLKRGIEYLASRFTGLAALLAPPVIAGLVSASLLTVNAGMSRFSGVVQCDTLISNTVISATYTQGAGNIGITTKGPGPDPIPDTTGLTRAEQHA